MKEIEVAYKKLLIRHHPSTGGDQARFNEIKEAYKILCENQKSSILP